MLHYQTTTYLIEGWQLVSEDKLPFLDYIMELYLSVLKFQQKTEIKLAQCHVLFHYIVQLIAVQEPDMCPPVSDGCDL